MCKVRGNDVGMIFQDPLTSLNPTMTIGRQIAESVRLHRHASKAQARERAPSRCSSPGGHAPAPGAARLLPAPAVGRPAPAGDDRHGARLRARSSSSPTSPPPRSTSPSRPRSSTSSTTCGSASSMAVILITHDMGVIAGRTDRVAVMYAGKIVEEAADRRALPRHAPPLLRGPPGVGAQARPGRRRSGWSASPACPRPLAGRSPAAASRRAAATPPSVPGPVEPELARAARLRAPGRSPCFRLLPPGATRSRPSRRSPSPDRHAVLEQRSGQGRCRAVAPWRRTWSRSSRSPRASCRRQVGAVQGRLRRLLRRPPGRDLRAGRRVGLRQDDHRPPGGRPRAPTPADALRRRGHRPLARGQAPRAERRDLQLMFQDPYASLDPRMRVGTILARAARRPGHRHAPSSGPRVRRPARGGRAGAEGARALPPRVLRRPTPAHRPGPGPRPRPRADRGRRARLGPRRLHPGPDPQPPEGPAGATRPDLHLHLPRPGRGQVRGRHHRRHVPGQAGRDRRRPSRLRRRRPIPTPRP